MTVQIIYDPENWKKNMLGKNEKVKLRRELGLVQATALAITDMIGIGPFITIPLFLSTMGGPQAMIGWFLGALLAFCDGLVWCELGAAMPKAGGSYYYLREAYGPHGLGRWFSFLIVWQIMFSAPLSVASGSIGFANYCRFIMPGMSDWGTRILAACIPLILIALLYRGIKQLGRLSVILLIGVLGGCLWIIAAGLPHLSIARLTDFPPGAFKMNWIFWAGLGHATLYALYDYFGYYNVCYLGEEIRRPERTIPRAILISISFVGALYILMSSSILSVIPWREAQQSIHIASEYILRLQGRSAAHLMTILMLWIAFSSIFSLLLGYSRIPYAAAADGNFFRIFARLHAKGNFPTVSLVVLGLIASVFSLGSLPDVIGSLVATRVIIQYLPQAIGLFMLRFRAPNLERPFKMWLFPIPGIISVLGWLYILGTAKAKSLLFAFAVLLIGSAVFFVRSKIRHEWPFPSSQTYPGQS
jgi:amino acid transporter